MLSYPQFGVDFDDTGLILDLANYCLLPWENYINDKKDNDDGNNTFCHTKT